MWRTFPAFGTTLILCIMVAASYTFAVALAAARTRNPRPLVSARLAAYGTSALITTAVVCLAYAFVSHDFRLRYVAHYSDRSMSLPYLFTALWGGQDGSLLWWLFLLALYIAACVRWLGKRYVELQPYVIATLMALVVFFCVLMAFSANPFATSVAGAKADGEGLNPLLQNFYMIIHPPSLYVGFVGCSVPFAFAIAGLASGKLDSEWIVASRKWTLFAWLFLAIGNTLGMLWAYEELGWGGYWAWDPVENAALMPLITASAYVHSMMIQERRGLFKVWNITLVSLTFLLTIFGTFLTRSGAISSVHSFAQSSIGTYFIGFLILAFVVTMSLTLYRWPELRGLAPSRKLRVAALVVGWAMAVTCVPGAITISRLPYSLGVRVALITVAVGACVFLGVEVVFRRLTAGLTVESQRPRFESFFSREFTFLLNNWGLVALLSFVLIATTFPMISEATTGEKVSVGPPYYNAWVQPIGLLVFFLMGIGTLFGWKKTSPSALRKAFLTPVVAFVATATLHLAFGSRIGFPAIVPSDPLYAGLLGRSLAAFNAITPLLGISLCVFNAVIVIQEFVFLLRARTVARERTPALYWWLGVLPGLAHLLLNLPGASRRRYGGYLVHFGIVLMFLGFTGKSWNLDSEIALAPGQHASLGHYIVEYIGPRVEMDETKRMAFADLRALSHGKEVGRLSPAKFTYRRAPNSPTTEVAMLHTLRDDLYLVVGSIDPQTKMASLQIHVNPLVSWIWLGCLLLILGSVVCLWPELARVRAWVPTRRLALEGTPDAV
ncbi:MAG: cytochrome c-type biogenesis CcmF C-terminal domain-containing protein [Myxococcales bacterium]